MFVRRLSIERITAGGGAVPCPIAWIDNFAMRNFTNDAVFDDTLPVADGILEAGLRVPLDLLRERMDAWFRRKGYLLAEEILRVRALPPTAANTGETPCTPDVTSSAAPPPEPL